MSNFSYPPSAHGVNPESFGAVFCAMSIPFWDSWYKFLLERLEVEFPGLPEESKINQALGDLQLMACGIEAENSLVAWRNMAAKRGDFSGKPKKTKITKPRPSKLEKFTAAVKRELKWRKIFNF